MPYTDYDSSIRYMKNDKSCFNVKLYESTVDVPI